MKVKEGDPLEIYTDRDGMIIFKKYLPYGEQDWAKAKQLASAILKSPFALYDSNGECQTDSNADFPRTIVDFETEANCYAIKTQWDVYGYLITTDSNYDSAIAVLQAFLQQD
jgi:hypothetical protein